MEDNIITQLKECRGNPAKIKQSYLKKHGLLDYINEKTGDETFTKFKMKEKLDYIINGCIDEYCYCGNRNKPGAKYCSAQCTGRASINREHNSKIQKVNGKERYEKTQKTWMEKYGVKHNLSDPTIQSKVKNKKQLYYEQIYRDTFEKYGLNYELFTNKDYLNSIVNECVSLDQLGEKYFNNMPKMSIYRFLIREMDVIPYDKTSSSGEREVSQFIQELDTNLIIENNTRKVITPKELDIYIPEKKLAIEYHGLYWHSGDKNKKIHMEKYKKCNELGIDLLQIFEDEWELKEDIIKSIISSKMGYTNKLYARKCEIREVNKVDRAEFLIHNHIQGDINGYSFGLYYDDTLYSIFVIGKSRFKNKDAKYELLRYATKINYTIIGGFSKLLSHYKKIYSNESLLTFCDLRYSNGKTYEKFGTFLRYTQPNYFWWDKKFRLSRHKSQKHKLNTLLENFNPNLSEKENMYNNGFVQIWDIGNKTFLL